jgi:hypothetical protein
MIDLNSLTESDLGRGVVYTPRTGPREDGVITSWNDKYIFVRYDGDRVSKATNPGNLDFLGGPAAA